MRIFIAVACVILACVAKAAPQKLAIRISDSNGGSFLANIVFDGDTAFEYGPEISTSPDATFDLAANSWIEGESGTRITLAQAREWAEASRTKARGSMERMTDTAHRAFIEDLLSPSFALSKSENGIHLKSRFLSYTASEPLKVDATLQKRIFAFDVLNAYRKAMVLRQTPPFTQLEVTRVLREEAILPSLLITDITTPNGSVQVTIRYSVSTLTPEEEAKMKKPNQAAQTTPGS